MKYIQHLLCKSAETKREALIALPPKNHENITKQKNTAHLKLPPLIHKMYFAGWGAENTSLNECLRHWEYITIWMIKYSMIPFLSWDVCIRTALLCTKLTAHMISLTISKLMSRIHPCILVFIIILWTYIFIILKCEQIWHTCVKTWVWMFTSKCISNNAIWASISL